tara:strand:+ start:326 stop:460 length:135 start_codon:yes stop_codon:yes gene_type:complete
MPKHDEVDERNLSEQGRKSFWKLQFLLEDKMMEVEEAKRERETT